MTRICRVGRVQKVRVCCLCILLLFLVPVILEAQETRVVYLSGTGAGETVPWDFFCSAGMNSGHWSTIEVPSCWEQEGFGETNYGQVPFAERFKEEGQYRTTFRVPRAWKDLSVGLVFEGVMTDCRVVVNGFQAGPVHRGAFYRFRYDVSGLLDYGKENRLEVYVSKFSSDNSVNQAERKADYWVFGGIFRPVYLEVKPRTHIDRVAVDARADGSIRADVFLHGVKGPGQLEMEVLEPDGTVKGRISQRFTNVDGPVRMAGSAESPALWNPETPNLYTARFTLMDERGKLIHTHRERIGFRTVEVRPQDGIYVNGVRIKFKGVNRHTFHPDYGRTSSKALSIQAVELIKGMNMNAVRMSHYPPDVHFLDACDSIGLFVLDELAGWQWPPYDSAVGRTLLAEMISRDVNHPSIVMWDNGNEGGWNTSYDGEFRKLDIQEREVNHPWAQHGMTNTAHYVDYNYLSLDHFAQRSIFFPTEMIHGLYDGGLGAGLEDFWLRMWNHPLSAGGFLWVFADEGLKRSDTGVLDTDGNHAPDGILGPYLEKEGSYYAIRETWSPVYIEKRYITPLFNGIFRIQNRYHYTSLHQCTFHYQWIRLGGPGSAGATQPDRYDGGVILAEGNPEVDPLDPGQYGILKVPLDKEWKMADLLRVVAWDPHGRLIHGWSWPVRTPDEVARQMLSYETCQTGVSVWESDGNLVLESGGVSVWIEEENGRLIKVTSSGEPFPLTNGPVFRQKQLVLKSFRHFPEGNSHRVVADFGEEARLDWTMQGGGLLEMVLTYRPEEAVVPYTGASFSFPEEELEAVRYLGNGPYRVWKNRMAGVGFNVWEKLVNTTITGYSGFDYPEFRGYYSNLYWVRFMEKNGPDFTVFSRTEDLFLRLLTPGEPPEPLHTALTHPPGDLSFMLGIPAIGTKFKEPQQLGPQSNEYQYLNRRVKDGALRVSLLFDFRPSSHQP